MPKREFVYRKCTYCTTQVKVLSSDKTETWLCNFCWEISKTTLIDPARAAKILVNESSSNWLEELKHFLKENKKDA